MFGQECSTEFPLARVANQLYSSFLQAPFHLLPLTQKLTVEDVRRVIPSGPVYVCDVHVTDIEKFGTPIVDSDGTVLGYEYQGIINIDHHAPTPEMERIISSGVLAGRFVKKFGAQDGSIPVLTHHIDCDSVSSSCIMLGILPPHELIDKAVLDADHYCRRNPISDPLQVVDDFIKIEKDLDTEDPRKLKFGLAVLVLEYLLTGRDTKDFDIIDQLYELKNKEAAAAQSVLERKDYKLFAEGKVILVEADIDSEAFLPLFPEAAIIVVSKPHPNAAERNTVQIRLGVPALDQGITRNKLELNDFDPYAGGRFNAGSNKRGGGTTLSGVEYAMKVAEKYSALLA